jgi:predicted metalloprotease with PDZ domain
MLATPIRYTLRFPAPQTHYVSVEAAIPVPNQPAVELFMPVWTPGSYLVREFARHVEGLSVTDPTGKPLPFAKSRKNRWRVETAGASAIHISYCVYCREMSVRTNWVEDSFALINGASTFLTLAEVPSRPHEVRLEIPAHWKTTMTGLPEAPGGERHHYQAPDYDTLVDSPILAGNPSVYTFEVDGIPHFLINQGEAGVWDGPRSAADTETIVRQTRDLWGPLPYTKYVFLNLLTESSGGLEHRNSVCMMTSRWATRTRRGYLAWLDLVSHEYFHVWNVKSLRPIELGPFDYETENPTRSLWVAEGITDYYAPLILRRAGLSDTKEYLGTDTPPAPGSLSSVVATLQSTPGRLFQSAEQASFDAWIKLYRPDENSANTTISYYTKGAIVAWLLDARIRHATDGAKSLDDLMRLALRKFSAETGFTPAEFKALAETVAGTSLAEFFRHAVESTEELDYTEALDWFGLRFRPQVPEKPASAWLGVETKIDNSRLIVQGISRQSPTCDSGLNVEDEIVAIDDFRVRQDQLTQRLENYKPGDSVTILVSRRDQLMRIALTLSQEPAKLQLEIRPDATESQRRNLESWLSQQPRKQCRPAVRE